MRNLLMLIACFLACGTSFAQKTAKLSGKVTDEKGESIAYAMVALLSYPDTNMVNNIQTDFEGNFLFENIKAGTYVLSVRMVGYQQQSLSLPIRR